MVRVASALALLFWSTAALAGNWLAFHDPAGAFAVDLPGSPAVSNAAKPGANGKMVPTSQYVIDRGKSALIILASDFSKFDIDTGKALDGAVHSIKSGATRTVSDKIVTVDGQVGRDVVVIDKSGHRLGDRVFLVKKKLYQVMFVLGAKSDAASEAEAKRFQSSFHFTKH